MADTHAPIDVSGTIVSFTVIRVPTPEFAQEAPYGLAVVHGDAGERLLVRVVGPDIEQLSIGATVVYDHSDEHGAVYRLR
jgi:uncharacterized OB-fold protein